MLLTVTPKGQVTIPMNIRSLLNIGSNERVTFIVEGDRIILTPVKSLKDLRGSVKAASGDAQNERANAKIAVAERVRNEMA